MRRVAITGASGLIGFHVRAALKAANAQANYSGSDTLYDVRLIQRCQFESAEKLAARLADVDIIVHLAAVNRPGSDETHADNVSIANTLVKALDMTGSRAQLVYSNSTYSITADNAYGMAKAEAARLMHESAIRRESSFVNLVLPHVFGEAGRPNHNNVTATLCVNAVTGVKSQIHKGATVELIHASDVADHVVAALGQPSFELRLEGVARCVKELNETILGFHRCYRSGIIPDVSTAFARDLFNTYRWYDFPGAFPHLVAVNSDSRGELYEAVKGGGGGQTFVSWTEPAITRGNHFHRRKVERFLVLSGEAVIRLRCLFTGRLHEFPVAGSRPAYIDMPTFHTHHIENTGNQRLMTLFWASEVFDPANADTYMEPVLELDGTAK